MDRLEVRPKEGCRWDLVSLGEVMLRLDPGDGRVSTTRSFRVWEGGGEYNVARGLRRCFGMETSIVTALADNPVGRLVQDCINQGSVDQSHIKWVPYDSVGRTVRNGLNFVERGFGLRAPLGCSDRGHTAVSQLKPGDIDWDQIFYREGARWFHTGGIFAALSETTPLVAKEAMQKAKEFGTVISYDLNYRESLWKSFGGRKRAIEVNTELASYVDVMFGNEEDFNAALGFETPEPDEIPSLQDPSTFRQMIRRLLAVFPHLKLIAVTLRNAKTATRNDWGAICWYKGDFYSATLREDLEIYDRIGGGDSFASGLIYGFLTDRGPQWSVECGAAHGALAMTTPGDTTMATLSEVEKVMKGMSVRVAR
jgi:2-dehydro-3-deoxygluconokinase